MGFCELFNGIRKENYILVFRIIAAKVCLSPPTLMHRTALLTLIVEEAKSHNKKTKILSLIMYFKAVGFAAYV